MTLLLSLRAYHAYRGSRSRQQRSRRRGSALIMVALGIAALLLCCALVIDYGALVQNANKVQRGCDAAALAGASQLQGGDTGDPVQERQKAQQLAIQVAATNGVTVNPNGTSTTSPDIWFDDNSHPTTITVRATLDQKFMFGPVAHYLHGAVTRQATARIAPCNAPPANVRVVPLGITQSSYALYRQDAVTNLTAGSPKYETFTLIGSNQTAFDKDQVVAFDLRGPTSKSPSHFDLQLTGTELAGRDYPTPMLNPTMYETTLDANTNPQGTRLEDGMGQLFTSAQNPPWNDTPIADINNPWATAGQRYSDILHGNSPLDGQGHPNPRIMNLIVTPSANPITVGSDNLQIAGFAPVYVQQIVEDATSGTVKVTVGFLPTVVVSSAACGGTTSGSLTGNRAVVLIG